MTPIKSIRILSSIIGIAAIMVTSSIVRCSDSASASKSSASESVVKAKSLLERYRSYVASLGAPESFSYGEWASFSVYAKEAEKMLKILETAMQNETESNGELTSTHAEIQELIKGANFLASTIDYDTQQRREKAAKSCAIS